MLDLEQRLIVYYSNIVSAVLSLFGGGFIICVYLSNKSLHTYPFKLICILSLFDCLCSIGFLLPTHSSEDSDAICILQAVILNAFTLCSVIWSFVIAFSIYMITVRSKLYIEKYCTRYVFIVLLICVINTLIPYLSKSYGTVAGWCWIKQNTAWDTEFYERYLLFFIPLWLIIISNISIYLLVRKRLKTPTGSGTNLKSRLSLSKKLKYYPLTLIFCFLPYTLKGALELDKTLLTNQTEFYLTLATGFFRGINGFLNAIVYGFTKKVKKIAFSCCDKKLKNTIQDDYGLVHFSTTTRPRYTILTNKDLYSSVESINQD